MKLICASLLFLMGIAIFLFCFRVKQEILRIFILCVAIFLCTFCGLPNFPDYLVLLIVGFNILCVFLDMAEDIPRIIVLLMAFAFFFFGFGLSPLYVQIPILIIFFRLLRTPPPRKSRPKPIPKPLLLLILQEIFDFRTPLQFRISREKKKSKDFKDDIY